MAPEDWLQKALHNPTSVPSYLWNWVFRPRVLARGVNRFYHRKVGRYKYNSTGVDILAKDWDHCLLLDACRYDMFEEQYENHDMDGELTSVISRASSTNELFQSALSGTHHDVVYITANPMLSRVRHQSDVSFHAEVHVWEDSGWDDTYQTVLPETMAEYVHRAADQFPSKRLFVHFLQPHYPFLTTETEYDKKIPDIGSDTQNLWGSLWRSDIDIGPDDIWPAYRANLDAVLTVVADLLSEFQGKTIVTSDHGNHVGERAFPIPIREWGHPEGIYTKQLVNVPWFVSKNGPRKSITAEKTTDSNDFDTNTVEDRLEALGYR